MSDNVVASKRVADTKMFLKSEINIYIIKWWIVLTVKLLTFSQQTIINQYIRSPLLIYTLCMVSHAIKAH